MPMSRSPRSETLTLSYIFGIFLSLTIVIYVLRGVGILTFLPGGILWLLIFLSIGTGIAYGIQKTRRY